jgi:Na+/H+ antiporter NhaA
MYLTAKVNASMCNSALSTSYNHCMTHKIFVAVNDLLLASSQIGWIQNTVFSVLQKGAKNSHTNLLIISHDTKGHS